MLSWYYGPGNDFPALPLCSIMEEVHVIISRQGQVVKTMESQGHKMYFS